MLPYNGAMSGDIHSDFKLFVERPHIANAEIPGYRSQDVDFQAEFHNFGARRAASGGGGGPARMLKRFSGLACSAPKFAPLRWPLGNGCLDSA